MPILILVASTLLFWAIYWFIRMGGVDHFRERSARRRDEARRVQVRESERTAPLRATDDPRDAARTMRAVFGFDHDVNERLTHARFIASCAQSFAEAARLFADLFKKRLTAEERRELVGVVEEVARMDGPSARQIAEIAELRRLVGLDVTG